MSSVDGTFDTTRQMAIIWDIDDVKGLDDSLTDEQAFAILKEFDKHKDGSMESMWLDLQYHIDNNRLEEDA